MDKISPETNHIKYSPDLVFENEFTELKIIPKGVIHVGTFNGQEIKYYRKIGFNKIVVIEANPIIYKKIKKEFIKDNNIIIINTAITEFNSTVDFHITSGDAQQSSILKIKKYTDFYPLIKEVRDIKVKSRSLDYLLLELNLRPEDFNFLNLNIQGVELSALKGSIDLLRYIEVINTEFYLEELYENCCGFKEVDNFLFQQKFNLKKVSLKKNKIFGNAFFVRKPVVYMSSLGTNGRFGNQIFQYFFMRIFAKNYGHLLCTPRWIGQNIFQISDPNSLRTFPLLIENGILNVDENSLFINPEKFFKEKKNFSLNVDLWGYFQIKTSFYAQYKNVFKETFAFRKEVEKILLNHLGFIKSESENKDIIAIHLRRGDYGYSKYYRAPSSWYRTWINQKRYEPSKNIIYICSEEPEIFEERFSGFKVLHAKKIPNLDKNLYWLFDFFVLTMANKVAISNSTFSFLASMLNDKSDSFVRPSFKKRALLQYDPWDSEVLEKFNVSEEDHENLKNQD